MDDNTSASIEEIQVVPCSGLPKNDAEMLACARTLWKSRVEKGIEPVICLSEGFYQHEAECVSDSVQMVLCSCDHFKEVVQPLLINGTVRMLVNIKPDDDIDNLITAAMPQEFLYLQGLQLRFARHYLNEYMRSKTDRATLGPFRSKGTSGIQCATSFKYFTDESKTVKVYKEKGLAGMFSNETIKSYRDILYLFKFYDSVNIPNKEIDLESLDVNSIISTYNTKNAIAMFSTASNVLNPGEMSHFTVYYTCGGHEYYYDNHTGVFPFVWSTFFQWMSDAKDTIVGPDMNIRIHRVDINFLTSFEKASQSCKYYPILEVYNVKDSSSINGKCYTLFPSTKDIIPLEKNKLGAYIFDDKVSGRYVKIISSLDKFFTETSVIPIVIIKTSTTIKTIPQILFSRNSNTVYSTPVLFGSSSNQADSTSNAAGVSVPPDYESESDDDGISINPSGHANQPVSTVNVAVPPGIFPDYESESDDDGISVKLTNQPADTTETNTSDNNYKEDEGMSQGREKRSRIQGGGRRHSRRKINRHTSRHRILHRRILRRRIRSRKTRRRVHRTTKRQ